MENCFKGIAPEELIDYLRSCFGYQVNTEALEFLTAIGLLFIKTGEGEGQI